MGHLGLMHLVQSKRAAQGALEVGLFPPVAAPCSLARAGSPTVHAMRNIIEVPSQHGKAAHRGGQEARDAHA